MPGWHARCVPASRVPTSQAVPARCAVHPSRPAAGRCPVCDRPRCAADAALHGDLGCAACRTPAAARSRPPSTVEVLTRAVLAALGAALVGGTVLSEYVDAPVFGLATPAVVGAACGAAAQAAAGAPRRGGPAGLVRAVAAAVAVLGVGVGLLLEGSHAPLSAGAVLPAALAVAGCLLWTVPPRRPATPGGPAG